MNIRTYYINLDESVDRKIALLNRLSDLGIDQFVTRFPALRGDGRSTLISNSELGCFLSHQSVISIAQDNQFTLVLEDDVFISDNFAKNIVTVLSNMNNVEWDILFLGQTADYNKFYDLKYLLKLKKTVAAQQANREKIFHLMDGKEYYRWGAFAYVINPNSLTKIKSIFNDKSINQYDKPVDDFFAEIIKSNLINAKIIFPYLIGVNSLFDSTMVDRAKYTDIQLHNVLVNIFLDGGSPENLKGNAKNIFNSEDVDEDALIVSHVFYQRLLID